MKIKGIFCAVLYFTFLSVLYSCQNKCDIQKDINVLKAERTAIESENKKLNELKAMNYAEIGKLSLKVKELKIYESGNLPKYFLRLRFSVKGISISNNIRNNFTVDIMVDRRFYEKCYEGDKIGGMVVESKYFTN